MIDKEKIMKKASYAKDYLLTLLKWIFVAGLVGAFGGAVGSLFHLAVEGATSVREDNPFLIYFLPLGGLFIVFLYRFTKTDENVGTNLVISSVRTDKKVPVLLAPLIFISTSITHLLGGSAGREGAALQLGGSIAANVGRLLKLDDKDMSLVIMCGMSAVFSALFGTPMTASFFAMEVISVGVIHYSGLVPCIISSLTAFEISLLFGSTPTHFNVEKFVPVFDAGVAFKVALLAALCAIVSIIFCTAMKMSNKQMSKIFKNTYLRIFVGGLAVVLLTVIVGNQKYNGAGMSFVIEAIENGSASWYDFLLKIIFTAITISAGFKGGEIVPTFFIGATFGCAIAPLVGLPAEFGAAVGLIALFCGVVNCPAASIFLSIEIFGIKGLFLFVIASAVSYLLSGYYGLYSSQKIVYSKLKPEYINVNVK